MMRGSPPARVVWRSAAGRRSLASGVRVRRPAPRVVL